VLPLRKFSRMNKKIVLLVALALIGVVAYFLLYSKKSKPHNEEVKIDAVAEPRYSQKFSESVNGALENYYALSEAFVTWDSAAINANAALLKESTENLAMDELKANDIVYKTAIGYQDSIQKNIASAQAQTDITGKRHAFNALSQHFYNLLRTVDYSGGKVFLQECPMAFNDVETGLWLSNNSAIRNPYLGLHHPKYRSGMLECGQTKDSLALAIKTVQ